MSSRKSSGDKQCYFQFLVTFSPQKKLLEEQR